MEDAITTIISNSETIQIGALIVSILAIVLIQLASRRNVEKMSEKIATDLSLVKKQLDIQNTFSNQFNDHFSVLDSRLKSVEEITALTSRDIAAISEGINSEVGIGKAIELARNGATVEEILQNSTLKEDQVELIVQFHGKKDIP